MKNMKDIINHLRYSPEFKKINTQSALNKLIDLLPPNLKKGVYFTYTKQQTLFFVLTHPVYKMEFKYNESLIRNLLKTLKIANIEDIKFFVTNKIEKNKKVDNESVKESYIERSNALFDNNIDSDENLRETFEKIREIIKN
jgi:hypothetical protein